MEDRRGSDPGDPPQFEPVRTCAERYLALVTERPEKLMLLDTASLYFRAFYGMPDSLRAPDGTPVNAVRGLLDFVARLVTDHRPATLVACLDADWRPQWRVDLIPSYKAHRAVEVAAHEGGAVEESDDTPDDLAVQFYVSLRARYVV